MPISFSSFSRGATARGTASRPCSGRPTPARPISPSSACWRIPSGMIGLPLRLLAREVYNKVVGARGRRRGRARHRRREDQAAATRATGSPRSRRCRAISTSPSSPSTRSSSAPISSAATSSPTACSTGAAATRPWCSAPRPCARMVERAAARRDVRLAGRACRSSPSRASRSSRACRARSAIVAFSAEEVYAIAELIRRQRGGAAVVLGALSPRTRNAQVALYQAGDVDYLVATDAIGMGLNLDVDHVAFAGDPQVRRLPVPPASTRPSSAQIAGRAGRHTRDGTFGTTGRCPPFEPELAQALESHTFEPIKVLQWRNTELDFASIGALQASLAKTPTRNGAAPAPRSPKTSRCSSMRRATTTCVHWPRRARRSSACGTSARSPTTAKSSPATHAELVSTSMDFLCAEGVDSRSTGSRARSRWPTIRRRHRYAVQPHRPHQDLDVCREPAAMACRSGPLARGDPRVEDKLSDALHERLAERFVDRRTSVLMRRLRENAMLETEIYAGPATSWSKATPLVACRLPLTPDADGGGSRRQGACVGGPEGARRRDRGPCRPVSPAPIATSCSPPTARIRWRAPPSRKLTAGDNVLRPHVRISSPTRHLNGPTHDRVQTRLDLWLAAHVETAAVAAGRCCAAPRTWHRARPRHRLPPSSRLSAYRALHGRRRGALPRPGCPRRPSHARRPLGAHHMFVPALLKPAPARARRRICGRSSMALSRSRRPRPSLRASPHPAAPRLRPIRRCRRRAVASSAIASAATGGPRRRPRTPRRSHPPGARLACGH